MVWPTRSLMDNLAINLSCKQGFNSHQTADKKTVRLPVASVGRNDVFYALIKYRQVICHIYLSDIKE